MCKTILFNRHKHVNYHHYDHYDDDYFTLASCACKALISPLAFCFASAAPSAVATCASWFARPAHIEEGVREDQ
jgi:hypothetical protein